MMPTASFPDNNDPRTRARRAARIAMMTAVAVAGGYLLIAVPNVELVMVTVALAGWMLGPLAGVMVGVFAAAIFGALNVFGLPYPPVWIAQMIGQALTGFFFGLFASTLEERHGWQRAVLTGALGGLFTLVYDTLTNLAFPVSTGVSLPQWWPYMLAAIPFAVVHFLSNVLIFVLLLPVAWDRIGRRYSLNPLSPPDKGRL